MTEIFMCSPLKWESAAKRKRVIREKGWAGSCFLPPAAEPRHDRGPGEEALEQRVDGMQRPQHGADRRAQALDIASDDEVLAQRVEATGLADATELETADRRRDGKRGHRTWTLGCQ